MNDLDIERYHLGELEGREKERMEAAFAADSVLAEKAAALRRQDEEIRAALPAALSWEAIEKKAAAKTGRSIPALRAGKARILRFPRPVISLAAAAILAAVLLPSFWLTRSGEEERAKGNTELSVYLRTPGGEERVRNNTVVREGNTVQLAYMSAEERYGVIFSLDGRSAVTLHYPYTAAGSTKLVPGQRTALTEAYTLDDAPDCEIFFFVTSSRPINAGEVLALAAELAKTPPTALQRGRQVFRNYELQTLALKKE